VGWLVPQISGDSVILWFDTLFQSWAKDTWRGVSDLKGIDVMHNDSTGVHEICLVDEAGWIYQLTPTSTTDGHSLNTGTTSGTMVWAAATGVITGLAGAYVTGDKLIGLPVLCINTTTRVCSWHTVTDNTAAALTITPAPAIGTYAWYLGAIDFWLEKAWSDGGEPSAAKIFERFFWRPTTHSQIWWAYLSIQRAFADYTADWAKMFYTPGGGRFQAEVWEQGVRLKWRLAAPIPGTSALQEAGWHGRIMPGTAYVHTVGTAQAQTTDIWPGDGTLDALVDIKDGARPSTGEV
jgi:hypothetical protein